MARLDDDFFIYTRHVNTVSNKHQLIPFYDGGTSLVKEVHSNTVKTTSSVFVLDKKKISSRYGYKNTRIEFSKYSRRSANYTTTVPRAYQPMYRQYFELIKMRHREVAVHSGVPKINNINFTSYLYGVVNPFSLIKAMDADKRCFINPVFFSSINLMTKTAAAANNSTQVFPSLTINSQNFTWSTVRSLGAHLHPLAVLIERDRKFNWACCAVSLWRRGFLDTPNKLLMCHYNELYYVCFPGDNARRNADALAQWPRYVAFMMARLNEASSDVDFHLAQRLGYFAFKNLDVIHVMWAVVDVTAYKDSLDYRMSVSFGRFLRAERLWRGLYEYVSGLVRLLRRRGDGLYVNGQNVEYDVDGEYSDGWRTAGGLSDDHKRGVDGKVAEYFSARCRRRAAGHDED